MTRVWLPRFHAAGGDRSRLIEVLRRTCGSPSRRRALVAEDDWATRELLKRTLQKDGWAVTEAALRFALGRLGIVAGDEAVARLMEAYLSLATFPFRRASSCPS